MCHLYDDSWPYPKFFADSVHQEYMERLNLSSLSDIPEYSYLKVSVRRTLDEKEMSTSQVGTLAHMPEKGGKVVFSCN